MIKRVHVITGDGSSSFYCEELKESYHSHFGAITESRHIFIKEGLLHAATDRHQINILEVGLGTGLNAMLTLMEATNKQLSINYTAIEPYRLNNYELDAINYKAMLSPEWDDTVFRQLHLSPSNQKKSINHAFTFSVLETDLEKCQLPEKYFSLVYFDAFAPDVQPELWEEKIFNKIYNSMIQHGILVTYSCKGIVKRALKAAGFSAEKIPGPPGKREMLRAKIL